MIERIVLELGPWNWMAFGLVLLILEILVPGIFMLWIGIAAIVVGALSLLLSDTALWTWQLQVVAFLALSLVCAYVGKQLTAKSEDSSDQPLLNLRAEQLIGRTANLSEAITNGHGRIRIGDTLWRVAGPDLPIGAKVRVVSTAGMELMVEPL